MNNQPVYCLFVVLAIASGCSGSSSVTRESGLGGSSVAATGGSTADTATGGTASGSTASGGTASGGTASGGTTGGGATGSTASGGTASGGTTGGGATGSTASGGATGGSTASEGNASGGTAGGGATGGSTASGGATGGGTTGGTGAIRLPTANAPFDYQIGGAYNPPTGVRVVSRDRNSSPAPGLYNICYVNGFQIQPDEEDFWASQHPDLILRDSSGTAVVDQDWGEMLLDTSTEAKRTALSTIIGGWIAQCKSDGFDAVEVDNLDSYSRSGGLLNSANNVAMMTLLSAAAHSNGLAIAQKNSSELLASAKTMGTDFAVVEECNRYSECGDYEAVYANLLFVIEYRQQDFDKGCTDYPNLSIVLRDLNVSPAGSSGYVYQGC